MLTNIDIECWIADFVADYPAEHNKESLWKSPLVAFAAAGNPSFSNLKELISPTHLLPTDLLQGAKTVVAYFLPFVEGVAESNKEGEDASRLWAKAYVDTNIMIPEINAMVKKKLEQNGWRAEFVPPTANFDHTTLISDWSHRHVSVIAGLGTFGRHNLLITKKGCCGRIGTLVTDLELPPSPLPEKEYCIEKAGYSCGTCIRGCVNGSLSEDPFNRFRCFSKCLENGKRYQDIGEAWVCGKCLIGLPCSHKG